MDDHVRPCPTACRSHRPRAKSAARQRSGFDRGAGFEHRGFRSNLFGAAQRAVGTVWVRGESTRRDSPPVRMRGTATLVSGHTAANYSTLSDMFTLKAPAGSRPLPNSQELGPPLARTRPTRHQTGEQTRHDYFAYSRIAGPRRGYHVSTWATGSPVHEQQCGRRVTRPVPVEPRRTCRHPVAMHWPLDTALSSGPRKQQEMQQICGSWTTRGDMVLSAHENVRAVELPNNDGMASQRMSSSWGTGGGALTGMGSSSKSRAWTSWRGADDASADSYSGRSCTPLARRSRTLARLPVTQSTVRSHVPRQQA